MKVKQVLLGMLASMAAGAAIAILLAPDKECKQCKKSEKWERDAQNQLKQKMDLRFDELLKAVAQSKKQLN